MGVYKDEKRIAEIEELEAAKKEIEDLKTKNSSLESELVNTQLALTDVYEKVING